MSAPLASPPTPDRRPAGRRGRGRAVAVVAVAAGLAVVAGLGLAALTSPGFDSAGVAPGGSPASPGANRPTSSISWTGPSSPLSSIPGRTRPPEPDVPVDPRVLTDSPLYDVRLPVGRATCDLRVRDPRVELSDAALAQYLDEVVDCLTTSLRPPLAAVGIDLPRPSVRTFGSRARTPCGTLRATEAPAYYCAANQTLYWPLVRRSERDAYIDARLGYLALTAHEYGHHLQAVTGIIQAYAVRRADLPVARREELSRRLELQAQCFEGVFLAHARDLLDITGQDRYELRLWHGATGDEDPPQDRPRDHGSSRAQIRWLFRGLDSGDFGRCNTWEASRDAVR